MTRPRSRRRSGIAALASCLLFSMPAIAQSAAADASDTTPTALRAELDRLRAEYAARIAALEAKIAALEAVQAAQAAAPTPTPSVGVGQQSNTYFNPSISVIGNFLAVAGDNPVEDRPNLSLSESEFGFQAVVDPYARADFFVSLGEEGAEIEEGFVTFTALPARFLAKVGRMRARFGKVNTLHIHTRPWPDVPLPLENLLGGDEGWIGDGLSVAKLLPIGDTFTELTVEAFHPASEALFESDRRSDLAYNAHYRVFGDLTDASNLDFGISYADGPNGSEGLDTRLAGLDFTYRWKPLRTATYRGLEVRGELLQSRREEVEGTIESWGWFLSGEYRLARRWYLGARYEWSERADDESLDDDGEALILTFDPSEFSRLRAELRRRRYAEDLTANEVLLQLQFIIGAHGAHPF